MKQYKHQTYSGDAVSCIGKNQQQGGSLQPGRNFNAGDYRFGFNGKENDNEVKGTGNSVDFGARMYDPRLGRWFSIDRYKELNPAVSHYSFALNNPISNIDEGGNFVIDANIDNSQQDRLRAFASAAYEALSSDPWLMSEFMKHSGLSKTEIDAIFTEGYGPMLTMKHFEMIKDEMSGDYIGIAANISTPKRTDDFLVKMVDAYTSQTPNPDDRVVLAINDFFDSDTYTYTKEFTSKNFFILMKVLHELVHLGDARDGISGNEVNYLVEYGQDAVNRMVEGSKTYGDKETNVDGIEAGKAFEATICNYPLNYTTMMGTYYKDYKHDRGAINKKTKEPKKTKSQNRTVRYLKYLNTSL